MGFPGTGWVSLGRLSTFGSWGDIGVGADGSVYVCTDAADIFFWTGGNTWRNTNVGGLKIAVGPDGDVWAVMDSEVRRIRKGVYDGTYTLCVSPGGSLEDIGIGAGGVPWVIGNDQDMHIFSGDSSGSAWGRQGGHGTAISFGDKPWHVGDEGRIYHWNSSNNWSQVDGTAHDIGIGVNGHVWHIGNEDRIYFMTGDGSWQRVDGSAKRIAVAPDGMPWVMNAAGEVYRRV